MDYGKNCDQCGKLDFLPFNCRRCGHIYCDEHRTHDCEPLTKPDQPVKRGRPKPPSMNLDMTESYPKSPATTLTTSGSSRPSRIGSHSSQAKPVARTPRATQKITDSAPRKLGETNDARPDRAALALRRLKALIGAGAGTTSAKLRWQETRPSPEQRRTAHGDSKIPQNDRIYLEIERPAMEISDPLTKSTSLRPSKTIWMFFEKSLNAGQVLDRASRQLGVVDGFLEADGEQVDVAMSAMRFQGHKLALVPCATS